MVADVALGTSIGELAMINDAPRAASLVSSQPGTYLIGLSKEQFMECGIIDLEKQKSEADAAFLSNMHLFNNLRYCVAVCPQLLFALNCLP